MPFARYTNGNGDTCSVDTVGHLDDAMGALRYIMDALPDEPLFVIRGRDVLALPVLSAYVQECNEHGIYEQAYRAGKHLERFREWQGGNAKLTHLPDPLPGESYPAA